MRKTVSRGARLTESVGRRRQLGCSPSPDAAIVLEPTGLDVVVAHKGVVRWQKPRPRPSCPQLLPACGENAIYRMAGVVTAIEQYAAMLAGGAAHPRCGSATVSVGTIHGGAGVNTVPDRCTIEIDRPLPGEELDVARGSDCWITSRGQSRSQGWKMSRRTCRGSPFRISTTAAWQSNLPR